MAQLATIATIASTAASVAQGVSQVQSSRKAAAQQQAAQAAQDAAVQAQAAERARQRQSLLDKTIASTRARLAASGASADSGSGRALIDGMRGEAAAAQDADERQFAARLAAGRRSLLDDSATLSGFTRAVRGASSLGSGLRSLLDVF
jgi:hypothetical protein